MDNDQPTPALPLEYFEQSAGAWMAVARWSAWVAMAYACLTIAGDVPITIYYFLPSIGRVRFTVDSIQMIVMIIPVAAAVALFIGALAILRRAQSGRTLTIGASVAMIVGAFIQFLVYVYQFTFSGSYRGSWIGFLFYLCVSQFFGFARGAFVPTLFVLLFCKREVRESLTN